MQWLNNLKIRSKLMVMTGISLALTVAMGAFALSRMSAVNTEGDYVADIHLPSVQAVGDISTATQRVQALQFQHIAMATDSEMNVVESRMEKSLAELAASRKAYEVLPMSGDEGKVYQQMKESWDRYFAAWPEVKALSRAQKQEEAAAVLVGLLDEYQAMDDLLGKIVAINAENAVTSKESANKIYANAQLFVVIAIVVVAVFGVILSLLVGNRIAKTITVLSDRTTSLRNHCISGTKRAISAMSEGDLSQSVIPKTQIMGSTDRDEIGDISRAVDAIISDVSDTIGAFVSTQTTIRNVIGETQMLVTAARNGDLTKRADAERHHGVFRDLVEGMNGTLAAVEAPIGEAKTVLARLADRDLTGRMSGEYRGDYAEMQNSINKAITNLELTLTQVASASAQVASASSQITAGGQSLASGSSEQAANLEEVSASVQEFSASAKRSASNAKEAQVKATAAQSDAAEGALRMQRLTDAVNEIKQSSAETSKIMKSIEEIAFQTNLLALNAAVEAARAGDAGRGFAVVADEVRSLAIRSAEASKTTAALIERGLASAERGVELNVEVSSSFTRITEQVGQVADVMSTIAIAAEQQASGVNQINVALEQLNAVTQQVAANAEESASAAEELNSQARSLNNTVSGFTLATKIAAAPRLAESPRETRQRVSTSHRPGLVFAGAGVGIGAGFDPESDPNDDAFLGF